MSSQPRAPTKQIRSHIVDPRRPITGTFYVGTPHRTLRESGVSRIPRPMKIPGPGR